MTRLLFLLLIIGCGGEKVSLIYSKQKNDYLKSRVFVKKIQMNNIKFELQGVKEIIRDYPDAGILHFQSKTIGKVLLTYIVKTKEHKVFLKNFNSQNDFTFKSFEEVAYYLLFYLDKEKNNSKYDRLKEIRENILECNHNFKAILTADGSKMLMGSNDYTYKDGSRGQTVAYLFRDDVVYMFMMTSFDGKVEARIKAREKFLMNIKFLGTTRTR